ncbi:NapC/NirT family cytochrome c [Streptococcus sanguinis SK408]|uniref:NapC/NirT family cytochrome c n=1 Tax=Streptococcus sanguinis SK408 TaxID=888818 RepID=F2CE70_STRSA|nr:NapC/NirT family cytochrome c [Streptococcus sanguinis SK408]
MSKKYSFRFCYSFISVIHEPQIIQVYFCISKEASFEKASVFKLSG